MINETIWLPCLVISVCLSAAFVAILMEHRRNGRVFVDQFCTWFMAPFRDPNYQSKSLFRIIQTRFQNSRRSEQELYILRLCQAVTTGGGMLIVNFIYPLLPLSGRALLLPLCGLLAWWAGTNLVAPRIAAWLAPYLNPDERSMLNSAVPRGYETWTNKNREKITSIIRRMGDQKQAHSQSSDDEK